MMIFDLGNRIFNIFAAIIRAMAANPIRKKTRVKGGKPRRAISIKKNDPP